MPGSVTVPSTLKGHAANIWRSAFLSAYEGSCADRDDKDSCAARIAWSAVKNKYKKGEGGKWVEKAGDPVVGPISSEAEAQPPLAYSLETLKPGARTKNQRWIAAYNKALAEDCRNDDNPTECARAYANKAVGRVETDVEDVEKTSVAGRSVRRIIERGGAGSGHRGHKGREGEVGGSEPGSGGGSKTTGTGFNETIGGKSPYSPAQKKKIKSHVFNPPSGKGLHEMRDEDITNTIDSLSKYTLKELRDMQDEVRTLPMSEHNHKLANVLSEAVNKREFPDEPPLGLKTADGRFLRLRGGPGSGHHGHRGRPDEVGGSLPGDAGGRGRVSSKAEEIIKGEFDKFATHHSGVAQMLEAWDRAKGYDDLYEGIRDEFTEALSTKLIKIIDDTDVNRVVGYQRKDPLGYSAENPPEPSPRPYERTEYERKMDGLRRHKFITKELEAKIPPLYSQEKKPDPTVWAKWFHPYATQEWYATEYDPQEGMFFGWINSGQSPELGYFSRQELAEANVRGIPIERDLYFDPARLSEVKEKAKPQISQEEYGFRLGSVLRGEGQMDNPLKTGKQMISEGAMPDGSFPIVSGEDLVAVLRSLGHGVKPRADVLAHIRKRATDLGYTMTSALKERMDVFAGYVRRADVRQQLNDVDYALIETIGDQEITRPDRYSSLTWRTMPPSLKNVRAEAKRRIIERNYAQAVEDAQIAGWRAKINHGQPDEYYFIKSEAIGGIQVIARSVLIRRADSMDWQLAKLSQFATNSLNIQLPKDILRHNKEQLLKLPVLRGGPGSGHHGHRGREGEVGGSLPSGGGRGVSEDQGAVKFKVPRVSGGMLWERKITSIKQRENPGYYDVSTDDGQTRFFGAGTLDEFAPGWRDMVDVKPAEPDPMADVEATPAPEPQQTQYEKPALSERLPELSLSELASIAGRDWRRQGKGINYAAKPYLEAMESLYDIKDNYMADPGTSIVAYFLSNAAQWKGDTAKMVKAELNKRLKAARR